MIRIFLWIMLAAGIFSCKKQKPPQNTEEMTEMTIEFDNIMGGQNLFINAVTYTNAAGEPFTVSLAQYYISNIKLRKADGTEYVVNQDSSYFLIKESEPLTRFARFKVPVGNYHQVSFIVGVDSLRSTMDITKRTGVLDPAGGMDDGMYWGWNSGYIFLKLEGTSAMAPVDPSGQRKYRFHIGGFGGYSAPTINNIKTITTDLTTSGIAQARVGRTANIHYLVDLMKVLNGTTNVSIAANPSIMFSDYSVNLANNYKDMFYHDHTEN